MYYYEVQVAGRAYHSKKPLTYQSESKIEAGSVVAVPVRNKQLSGFILKQVDKPSFEAKEISRISTAPPLSKASLQLHQWMEEYYPATSSATLQLFLPDSILKKSKEVPLSALTDQTKKATVPPLREQQNKVIAQIAASSARSFLLHGETGSGKTRVYGELAKTTLGLEKSVLILTPEIGLTSQLAAQIETLLDAEVIVLHSQITKKQRRERWKAIASSTKPLVVIGTRLALFAPFRSLGLVVVDEAHEDAYKQDQAPQYHATRVAAQLATIHKARLLLGSATPSVSDYSVFEKKKLPILRMEIPPNDEQSFNYNIVDNKNRSLFGRSPYLSSILLSQIEAALTRREQSLIYLNRRGTARLVLCQSCGWESSCPNCDIALTFHDDTHVMRCHTCGLSTSPPSVCPSCSSPDIYYNQIGTKSLISHIEKLFPDAKVARFDTDLAKQDRLEARYKAIHAGEIDILVGTQLLGKGLDLPKLSVVGVIQADSSLAIPDFSAREKTYQQLHQILGRVGRGHRTGHAVIQTYNPDSPLILSSVKKDYTSFLRQELKEREAFLYPPYCFMLQLIFSRKQSVTAEQSGQQATNTIRSLGLNVQLIGPSPAFKHRTHGNYHWQIVVKSKQRSYLLKIIESLPANTKYVIDPVNLL